MNSSLMMTPCPTEDKKLYSPSLPIPRHLLQNPAYTVAIPALLELQSGRTFSTGNEEKTIKLEVTQKPGSQPNRNPLNETAAFERYSEMKSDFSPMTTLLNYHPITAFNVGGELRLCLPQVMNSALKKYSLQQIEQKINELNIYISRCSTEQAKCLKLIKVLPERVPYCGLITKSNAERLVYELLEKDEDIIRENEDDRKRLKASTESPNKLFGFRVYHECFGKCKGTLYPVLFTEPEAKCIECLECTFMFSPNKFVCHAHRGHESIGICHWGFDSANWRSYLQISKDQENSKELDGHLEQMKSKTFDAADLISNGANKRKYESGNLEKVLITQIVPGQTPGKKFPRVECDSGFGSSPDSNSNGSSGLSPPVLTSVSCQNAPVSSSVSLNRPSVASKSAPYSSTSANAASEHSSLPTVGVTSSTVHHLKSTSEAFSSSSLNHSIHDKLSNASGSSGQVQFTRCQGPQLAVIKPGDKIPAALFSPHLTFPQINGQQDLQHQLIAIERPPTVPNSGNSHSTGSAAAAAAAAIQQISQQQQQPQAPSSFQRPSIVSNSSHHSNQIAPPPPIVIAAAAAAAQPPSAPSSLHHVTAPSLTVAAAAAAASGTPTVTMPTDWVSPELRMISQAMEVSIAKISAHCTPTVKIHLDQLVELLKEQQKQYLKDFAMTHQDNERLVVELKSREREINESKIALSRLRQQLERTELEVQKEKDLRLRTNVDLAQILRQQAAIGAYNSSLVQAQQQQLQSAAAVVACEKEGILGAVKRPKFLHVEVDDDDEVNSQKKVLKVECKTSPLMSPCAAESTECSPLREIACSKREESDEDPASSSSSLSTTAAAVVRYSSSSHVIARKTSAASSPPVIVTVRATSRESTSPLAPPPSGTTREDSNGVSVKRQLTPTIGGALTPPDPRSTPSPSYSNESSATLVIVDS